MLCNIRMCKIYDGDGEGKWVVKCSPNLVFRQHILSASSSAQLCQGPGCHQQGSLIKSATEQKAQPLHSHLCLCSASPACKAQMQREAPAASAVFPVYQRLRVGPTEVTETMDSVSDNSSLGARVSDDSSLGAGAAVQQLKRAGCSS